MFPQAVIIKSFKTPFPHIPEGVTTTLCNSYTVGCPPGRGDNPRALASGLFYVHVDKHGISILGLYHLHQCRPCTSQDIFAKVGKSGINAHSPPCRKDSSLSEISLIMFKIIFGLKYIVINMSLFMCFLLVNHYMGLGDAWHMYTNGA